MNEPRSFMPVAPNPRSAILFLLALAISLAVSFAPLRNLVRNGRISDYYTHIPLVPLISAYVFFKRRKKLFRGERSSPLLGLGVMAAGIGLVVLDRIIQPDLIGHAELCAGGAVMFFYGSYLALFGKGSFRKALFPFLFLVFLIPLPLAWMDYAVAALVKGSTATTHLLFRAQGIPFVQEGSVFYLPAFGLEVARECSGIRSSIGLVITSVLAGQIFLDRPWKKITLVLAVFPVTVLKNGVRIVTLYLLSYFVDMRIIESGFLHKSGGFIFFGVGLILLGNILWFLKETFKS